MSDSHPTEEEVHLPASKRCQAAFVKARYFLVAGPLALALFACDGQIGSAVNDPRGATGGPGTTAGTGAGTELFPTLTTLIDSTVATFPLDEEMSDGALLDAAEAGKLGTPDEIGGAVCVHERKTRK